MARLLDGLALAKQYKTNLREMLDHRRTKPRLDVILVGDNPASKIYVSKKVEACREVGIESVTHNCSCDNLWDAFGLTKQCITNLNKNSKVNGILVQLPLPFPTEEIFDLIAPEKDVDVFSPVNVGLLVQNRPRFLPPTPLAVQKLILDNGFILKGRHVVVINRSNVVGLPLSSMLIQDNVLANATVTVCHDNTPSEILKQICLSADIIVVAVGIPNFLTLDMVKEHQVIIDVGITRIGKRVVGDVHPAVKDKVLAISPVPGGVGPLTVAMLLYNTADAAHFQKEGE
jgi:methylenetetrahydrofolate dehydrogenase (NADP+)/methenyltetrahydrofolate cyclohydrolase